MNREKFANRVDELWNQLSIHTANKFNTENNTSPHYGIREDDFPVSKESIVEFINNKIDLDLEKSGLFLKTYLQTKENLPHWNESLKQLIDYYYNLFTNNQDENLEGIRKADAGNIFKKVEDNPEWVNPMENIGGDNYSEIRGADSILSILEDKKDLQFTIDQFKNSNDLQFYLRLIMPEYKHNVEIEDLNRNFWVIGQALTALYAYLFDEENPLPQLLSGLLDEILQLWENMFYLWLATSMSTEKMWNRATKFFIYSIADREIDNFSLELTQKEILQKIWMAAGNQIIDRYNDVIPIVMPEIKMNNYAKNYYATAIYPGIIIYDNSQFNHDYWLSILPFEKALIIDLKEKEIKLEKLGDDENEQGN